MFCDKCGAEVKDGSKFCQKCGEQIKNKLADTVQKTCSVKKILPALVCGVVVLCIGIIIYFVKDTSKCNQIIQRAEAEVACEEYEDAIAILMEGIDVIQSEKEKERLNYMINVTVENVISICLEEEEFENGYLLLEQTVDILDKQIYEAGKIELLTGEAVTLAKNNRVNEALEILQESAGYSEKVRDTIAFIKENSVLEEVIDYRDDRELPVGKTQYDMNGNIISFCSYDEIGNVNFVENTEYDIQGNAVEYISYDEEGLINIWHKSEYDSAGNQTKFIRYNADESIAGWSESEYDSMGNETKFVLYSAEGNVEDYKQNEYMYDSNQNIIKVMQSNQNGNIIAWWEKEYDNENNLIKCVYYDEEGCMSWWYDITYDDVGNETRYVQYNADGTLYLGTESEYDLAGNIIQTTIYRTDDWTRDSWTEYEYDVKGNVVKIAEYSQNGEIMALREYSYDSNGNKTNTYSYSNGRTKKYAYEYDHMGNITKTDYSEFLEGEPHGSSLHYYENKYVFMEMNTIDN